MLCFPQESPDLSKVRRAAARKLQAEDAASIKPTRPIRPIKDAKKEATVYGDSLYLLLTFRKVMAKTIYIHMHVKNFVNPLFAALSFFMVQ